MAKQTAKRPGKAPTARHGVKRSRLGSIAVFVIVALFGYLLMANMQVNRSVAVTSDAADLVAQRVQHVSKLQAEVKDLSSQINTFNNIGVADSQAQKDQSSDDAGSGTMLPAVTGPGISVTLADSPLWENAVGSSGSAPNINDYVIHQQDIEAVVNALWKGGAEAMMIQDQRVLFNSAVICKGNVLMLQGKKYAPPYTVSAIGPADDMNRALDESQAIGVYKEYVSAFGLGWKVETKKNLRFPESPVLQPMRYASVPHKEGKN
ncbi:hypothetical protein CRD60_04155 [Bifidobacterium aemilianum]|uniref:DUF881 domain-containing protein n=1 Tax=Bifidobacterium aemilianum TaxID=2493120 RepID=A0A366K7T5_9BIFI|nr:DUF881 domain-containing protein [Bifidobacterium aemilianum]RBP97796.1 hypothetical protein CRD60_04155 [Bifidobacterium aemilianum]